MKSSLSTCFAAASLLLSSPFIPDVQAQSHITGSVFDAHNVAVPYANVLLLSATDSTLVKGALTNDAGSFQFAEIPEGRYFLEVNMLGYEKHQSATLDLLQRGTRRALPPITLRENAGQINEVTITARKPFFEQRIDRLVVNVENSITLAGATALDVLERSPGVVVNRQSNMLSIAGKNGVVVMINGRINRMPIEAVVQMLAGMPSANIEKIELITTPPANFDAEGNAGYINLVLKKTEDQGVNGSYTFTGGYGRGTTASTGTNFNYRKNRFNLYGDYSFGRFAQEQVFTIDREMIINGPTLGTDTRSLRSPVQRNHQARLGVDLNLSEKTVLGVLVSGYDNRWSLDANTRSVISLNGIPDTLLNVDIDEINHWKHLGGNLNLQHTIRPDEVLTFDVDYLNYDNRNPADYYTDYTTAAGNFLFNDQTFSGKHTPIEVAVGRLDYSKRFSEKIKMETGIKGTRSDFDNDVTVSRIESGIPVNDPDLTAKYFLRERIAAAYSAFDIKLDSKSEMKLGLRYEYTNSNLGTVEEPDIVDRQYGYLFPSFFLSRNFTEKQSANLSYSRRISRPTFNDMAPFVFFFDPYTFFSGNAALQPAIADNVKLDYRFDGALFSIQYTLEDSAISNFQVRIIEGSNRQVLAAANMKNRKTVSFTASVPWKVASWWNMQNNLTANWQEANPYFNGELVRLRAANAQFVWINSFTLPRAFSGELFGYFQSRGLAGAGEQLPIWGVNIGLQKKFRDEMGTLRVGIDDVFNSFEFRFRNNLPEQNIISSGTIDFSQRTYKLSYSRNFGNNKLKSARQRATGAEEERRRVN